MSAPTKPHGFTIETLSQLIAERHEPEWMTGLRRAAWEAYEALPMPDSRTDEEWRRTNLRQFRLDLATPSPLSAPASTLTGATLAPTAELTGGITLNDGQVNRVFLDEEAFKQGVIITDIRSALEENGALAERIRQYFMTRAVPVTDSKFAALHGAFWDNGVFVYIPKSVTLAKPLGILIDNQDPDHANLTHTLVVMERDSQAHIIEEIRSPASEGQAFSSRVIELFVEDNAVLDYTNVQRLGDSTLDFYTTRAVQGRDTRLAVTTVELGARLSKGRIEALLAGNGADTRLYGLYMGDRNQHYDRFTLQDHTGTNTTSDLLFKGVLTDEARSVYSGFIRVHPGAKQSRAYQQNRNILLSRTARADSIPNLEISENDILGCTHGATVGKVDEDEVFYLMCRGLSRTEAVQLLVEGYVEQVIVAVPLESMQESLREEISRRVATTTAKMVTA